MKFVVVEVFKRIGENGSRAPPIPKLGINGGEWSVLRCDRFNTRKRATTNHLTLRRLMSYIYIYGAPILDVSRSHTTTQHSR